MKARKRQRALDNLRPYVADVQRRLGLGHWRVDIGEQQPEGENNAQVFWWHMKYRATIIFADGILRADPAELRYTVVHELLHLHLRGLNMAVPEVSGKGGRWEYEEELAVDGLAQALAPLMPLPPPVAGAELGVPDAA